MNWYEFRPRHKRKQPVSLHVTRYEKNRGVNRETVLPSRSWLEEKHAQRSCSKHFDDYRQSRNSFDEVHLCVSYILDYIDGLQQYC